jgi:hypothetical protein
MQEIGIRMDGAKVRDPEPDCRCAPWLSSFNTKRAERLCDLWGEAVG